MRCLLLTVTWLCVAAPAGAQQWNQWRGAERNGVARVSPPLLESLPAEGLQPIWRSEPIPSAREGGWSSPVVSGGKVYVFTHTRRKLAEGDLPPQKYPWLSEEKRVGMTAEEYAEYEKNRRAEDVERGRQYEYTEKTFCLDLATGQTLWINAFPSVYTRFPHSGSPAVIDGKLYVLGAGKKMRAIDATSGASLWDTQLPGEFLDEFMMSSFAVADGAVIGLAGWLVSLDAESGKLLWQGDEQQTRGTHSSPVVWEVDGRELAVVNVAGDTICVEPRSGKELWRVESEPNHSTPVLVGNRLLTYSGNRSSGLKCYEMSLSGAELVWHYRRVADKGSSPVVVGNNVYVQGERRLACVDLETGDEQWGAMLDLATPQYTSLIAADNKVFYAHDGVLWFAATPDDFQPLVAAKIDRAGLLATEETHRQRLKMDELERQPDGLEKAVRLWQAEIDRQGPQRCITPAIVDGKLLIRLPNAVVCYDLTDRQQLSQAQRENR